MLGFNEPEKDYIFQWHYTDIRNYEKQNGDDYKLNEQSTKHKFKSDLVNGISLILFALWDYISDHGRKEKYNEENDNYTVIKACYDNLPTNIKNSTASPKKPVLKSRQSWGLIELISTGIGSFMGLVNGFATSAGEKSRIIGRTMGLIAHGVVARESANAQEKKLVQNIKTLMHLDEEEKEIGTSADLIKTSLLLAGAAHVMDADDDDDPMKIVSFISIIIAGGVDTYINRILPTEIGKRMIELECMYNELHPPAVAAAEAEAEE